MGSVRIALLADVHGNLPALQAVLADMRCFNPDAMVVAGDLSIGPGSHETTRLLLENGAICICGNSDINLLKFLDGRVPGEWNTVRQFALLRHAARTSTPELIAFLRSLPLTRTVQVGDAPPLLIAHGSPDDPYEGLDPENPERIHHFLAAQAENVLVCGHTHQPYSLEWHGRLAINPGSVACPLNGQIGAQWALLEWAAGGWQVDLRCVQYDLALIRRDFIRSGMLDQNDPLARAFLLSMYVGADLALDFLSHARNLAREAGLGEIKLIPDDIWQQADENFDWTLQGRLSERMLE